ncbi:solute carrier family 2, facilitated glucose transporter member 11 [Callorhinchus milii]|uniref:solute carrier family 2, facilitated glucose transporter member 11 n=1 Tax=Callorhinchus milii TaxID=7868 RepID=UPI0004575764|nr:solute carrier family 2, facilitated glucose transporter member 11 [Callorhinchus milii]|eukprot:gi/632983803/ref/XP_007908827.1/ PREDICTED: solute carrier family 2, facilitated glucose transporter member 11-like [Callorhinchus milii]
MLKKLLQGHLLFPLILVAGIGGSFQYGFNVSSINANSAYIKLFIAETWAERFGTKLEDTTVKLIWSLVVSIYPIGGLLGTLNAGHLAVKYGRKKVLLFNNLVDILAATIMLLSRMARSFEMIMVGRFLYGINAGIGLNVQSMYLGESSPIKLRGVVSLTRAMFVAFGKVTGQTIGLREVLGTEHRWHFLLAFSGLPALIQLISLPWFPDSPRYLLIDRQDKVLCLDALQRLWGKGDFSEEIADMEAEQAVIKGEGARTAREMFRDRSIRWQLITNVMVTVAMQLCGINAIYFYASEVFQEAGIPSYSIPYVVLGAGGTLLFTSLTCGFFIERDGRKALLWKGYGMMTVWATLLCVTLPLQARFTWMPYCSIFLIFAYIFSYGMGPAGVTAIIPFEIFTQSCRPVAYAINGTFHWLGLFVMGMVFPFIVEGLGPFCFLIFLGDCLVIAVYVFIILPETKGKSILEITAEFQKLNQRRAGPVTLLDGVKFKQNNPEIFIIATKL